LQEALQLQARGLGIEERVHFLGFRRDIANVIGACDVVALPSSKEGLSIAVMEAMALRRPVIATNIAGMPELVRDGKTGLLIPPEDVGALADALRKLLGDADFAARMAQQGRAFMEQNFDQRTALAEVERFLRDVVDEWCAGRRLDCTSLQDTAMDAGRAGMS
jgi:glycosyltransferase involved in cell wall biosynthesis